MPAISLTPTERKARRSEAQHLQPVVSIGAAGLTDAVLKEADAALAAHGLIKLRVHGDDRAAREALLAQLAERLHAAPVQHIGKLLVLWRPLPERAPAAPRGGAPRSVKVVTFADGGSQRPAVRRLRLLGNQRLTAAGTVKRKKVRQVSLKKKALSR